MNILISLISNFNLFISNPTPPLITTPDSSNNDGIVLTILLAIAVTAVLCAIPILIAVYAKSKRKHNPSNTQAHQVNQQKFNNESHVNSENQNGAIEQRQTSTHHKDEEKNM